MLIIHHSRPVKNITFMGNLHIGVRNQGLVPGKNSGSPKDNNEILTSLISMTYKILYTKVTRKYMLLT